MKIKKQFYSLKNYCFDWSVYTKQTAFISSLTNLGVACDHHLKIVLRKVSLKNNNNKETQLFSYQE